jgi:hypothetical protein
MMANEREQIMFPQSDETISFADLPPANPSSALATEWETYRREVGRLLAEGQEGKFALIRGHEIIGLYESWDEARKAGLERFLMQQHMVHPVLAHEPVLRGPGLLRSWQG